MAYLDTPVVRLRTSDLNTSYGHKTSSAAKNGSAVNGGGPRKSTRFKRRWPIRQAPVAHH